MPSQQEDNRANMSHQKSRNAEGTAVRVEDVKLEKEKTRQGMGYAAGFHLNAGDPRSSSGMEPTRKH